MLGIFRDPWLEDRETRQREQRAKLLGGIGLIGALFTGAFLICSQWGGVAAAIGVGGLILMAAASAGAGLGFLFSVPRVLSVGPAGISGARASVPSRLLGSNTNLERISEWLTTMIVGVGLSQMTSIGEGLGLFTQFLATWGQSKPLAAAGPFILIVGLVSGFVFLYLYTRLFLSPLFLHVEKMMTYVGDEENSVDTAEIRMIAQQLAESTKSSHMRAIADTDRLTFEQTMQVLSGLLYENDGYRQVLRIGEKLRDTHAAEMASYWFIMAAANGQYYSSLQDADPDEQRSSVRQAVLDASRRAVAHDPQYKRYLAELTRKHGKDNDLQDFAGDKEFLRIVR
jgi:hypothetical protein